LVAEGLMLSQNALQPKRRKQSQESLAICSFCCQAISKLQCTSALPMGRVFSGNQPSRRFLKEFDLGRPILVGDIRPEIKLILATAISAVENKMS
jgi:hypothetical protein